MGMKRIIIPINQKKQINNQFPTNQIKIMKVVGNLKKPVNLFFMTLISCCGIVGGFITWIIPKNQFNKKIGGKRAKKKK